MKPVTRKRVIEKVPPWLLIGVLLVLFPIFTLMTVTDIRRQESNNRRLLAEKAAALIRSFEAGTRTGLLGEWSGFQLQRLLMETAQQPDIIYLMVTDANGVIVAHSDPSKIGSRYISGLNYRRVLSSTANKWRFVSGHGDQRVFEVFRRFSPDKRRGGQRHHQMMRRRGMMDPSIHMKQFAESPRVIFVGLDMTGLDAAEQTEIRNTIIMGGTLFFFGLFGIVLLFVVQSYRSARTSLTRIKAFSDHLVETIPIGLLTVDTLGRVSSFNQVAKDILRLPEENGIDSPAAETLPRSLWEAINSLEHDSGVVEQEVEAVLTDGAVVPLEIRTGGLAGEEGENLGSVMLFKDLSEVRALRKEVARSQRLATVGRLAAGVAHEIRNPLSSIKGFATYFKERYKDVTEDKQIADIMVQEVDRLNRVVGQLLEFARPVRITPTRVDIHEFIADSLKLIQQQAEGKGITIDVKDAMDRSEVVIDVDRMRQVMLNLYLNAIEAMVDGGQLTVQLIKAQKADGMIIQVVDTGVGILAEDLAHIFDPYFTTKPSGTGIGLALAHNIIKAHGGWVTVESEAGSGTRFSIFIPRREGEATDEQSGIDSGRR